MALVFNFWPVDYVKDNEKLHKSHKGDYKFIKRFENTYKKIYAWNPLKNS